MGHCLPAADKHFSGKGGLAHPDYSSACGEMKLDQTNDFTVIRCEHETLNAAV